MQSCHAHEVSFSAIVSHLLSCSKNPPATRRRRPVAVAWQRGQAGCRCTSAANGSSPGTVTNAPHPSHTHTLIDASR